MTTFQRSAKTKALKIAIDIVSVIFIAHFIFHAWWHWGPEISYSSNGKASIRVKPFLIDSILCAFGWVWLIFRHARPSLN